MKQYIKKHLHSLKTWSSAHRKTLALILGFILIGGAIIYGFHVLPAWKMWLAIWIASVITPVILGMLGKVGFKWAVLWECVMFFPVVLILCLFVQDIRSYVLRGVAK